MSSDPLQQRSEAVVSTVDVSALRLTLRPLEPILASAEVTELCINRP
jgi:hypothetical protein